MGGCMGGGPAGGGPIGGGPIGGGALGPGIGAAIACGRPDNDGGGGIGGGMEGIGGGMPMFCPGLSTTVFARGGAIPAYGSGDGPACSALQ